MPRRRAPHNRALPRRWTFYHGAYYYRVPGGNQRLRLGATLAEAYRTWATLLADEAPSLVLVGQLLDRYETEVLPGKAAKTQSYQRAAIARLRATFSEVPIADFTPAMAYKYRDLRGKASPTAANRELEVLSHAFTKAIEWGVPLQSHPMRGGKFQKLSLAPRTRYVEDWELTEAMTVAHPTIRAYIPLKLLTGRRRSELLSLRQDQAREDGIHFRLTKSVKRTGQAGIVVRWTPALKAAWEAALAARPAASELVFCTRQGKGYIGENGDATGWDSLWQRFMRRVLSETKVTERFTEHDLRAKAATDLESVERASKLLAHTSLATTRRVYRRKPESVEPLR